MEIFSGKSYERKRDLVRDIISVYEKNYATTSKIIETYRNNILPKERAGLDSSKHAETVDDLIYIRDDSEYQIALMGDLLKSPILHLKSESKMRSQLENLRAESQVLASAKV